MRQRARGARHRRSLLAIAAATLGLAAFVGTAQADITPSSTPNDFAPAIINDTSWIAGDSAFDTLPPRGVPNATATAPPVGGFPIVGPSYAIFTSGDPVAAGSAQLGGGNIRGVNDRDVSILRIPVSVPAGANCLSLDYRFFTNESAPGTKQKSIHSRGALGGFRESFIAEVDTSDWTTTTTDIVAPHDFATDSTGYPMNAATSSEVTPTDPLVDPDVPYERITPLMRASTPITAGQHTLFLSIYDWSDEEVDSGAYVDRLHLTANAACAMGSTNAGPDVTPPLSSAAVPACSADGIIPVTVADEAGGAGPQAVHYKVDGGAEQVVQTAGGVANIGFANGAHTLEYWGDDANSNLETAHHSAAVNVDTVNKCKPPATPAAPKVGVAGVRRACTSASSVRVRFSVNAPAKVKSVRITLDGKTIKTTTKSRFTLRISLKKLKAGHHRLRVIATDQAGKRTTVSRTLSRCAPPKPRRKAAPRFTG